MSCLLPLLAACSYGPHVPAPVRDANFSREGYGRASYQGEHYKVRPGDTLFSIAWLTGTDFRELAIINGISAPYLIKEGQTLTLHNADRPNAAEPLKKKVKKNSSDHQEKKLDKRHANAVDSLDTGRYGRSQAGHRDPARKRDALPEGKGVQWQWPTKGRLIGRFSASKTGAKGIDIRGKLNQPIAAAGNGKVVYAGSGLRGYGELIIIKHSDDFLSAYAHNRRLRVAEGEWVTAGQHIADMGSTGTDRVKLRFEIRLKGLPVDPMRYLPR